MDAIDAKTGLNNNFRQYVLNNVIMPKLKERVQNTTNPVYSSKLEEIGIQFERVIYNKAISKDDHLNKIQKKLQKTKSDSSYGDVGASTPALNHPQKPLPTSHQLHALQKPMPTSLSTLQQGKTTLRPPGLNQSQLQGDRPSERFNSLHPSVQQIRPMREPMQTTNSMLNIESHQQPSQHRGLTMKPQEQGTRCLDTWVQESNMPSTSPCSQTLASENKRIPQLQVARTTAAAGASFLDPETINAADPKLLIAQYHRARTMYLPEFIKLEKRAAEEYVKAQNVNQREMARRLRLTFQQSIKHLSLSDWDLMRTSKEVLRYYLNKTTTVLKSLHNKMRTKSAGGQVPQFPNRNAISVNHQQYTPPVNTTTFNSTPMICSSTMENGIPCSKSKAPNMQTVLHRGPQRTAEQNDHFNLKQDPEPMQSSSMNQPVKRVHSKKPQKPPEKKDFMDSMFLPMNTKATFRNSQCQTSRAHPKISRLPKRNTSVSNPRAILQPKPLIIEIDPTSTPATPYSVPKQIENSAKSVSPNDFGASKAHDETDKSFALGTPGALTSILSSDLSSPESNRLSESAKLPIDRLIQVLQSVSKEALKKSMADIASAINDTDKLPEYASYDEYEVRPGKKLKRDVDSISRDISTSLNNHDFCTERIRNASNHDLVLKEIREINQRLLETRVEVASGSSEWTIIRCIYKDMATSYKFKRQLSLTTLSAVFLVPSHYPELPPKFLDSGLSHGSSLEIEDLAGRAKSIFEGLMSIGEIAKAWDDYARQAFIDLALYLGGESFISKFGAWREVPAA